MKYNGYTEDTRTPEQDVFTRWNNRITKSKKEYSGWLKQAKKIYEIYKNNNEPGKSQSEDTCPVKYNIVWSTHQLTKEAFYARVPKTVFDIRHGFETPASKLSQIIGKRNVDHFICNPDSAFHYNMCACRDDFRLIAQGQAWIVYRAENETKKTYVEDEAPEDKEILEDEQGQYYQEEYLKGEDVEVQYVPYEDYLQDPARRWKEVKWVARRTTHTKAEMKELFGSEIASQLVFKADDDDSDTTTEDKLCEVWEIWDKKNKKVHFFSENYKEGLLKSEDPPCQFKNFFPCPRPILATTSNDSMVPVADAAILKYYVTGINSLAERIDKIRSAVKVFGVFDSSSPELADVFSNEENYLHPLTNWSRFLENGKFDGAISMFPISEYVAALDKLNSEKNQMKSDYYEQSGVASIMRLQETSNESAAAIQSRSRFLDMRLAADQKEVQRFARDCIAIMAEAIFQKLEPETILNIAGIFPSEQYPPELVDEALNILKDEINRTLVLTIETDSTLAVNGESEKQDRLEFMNTAINAINTTINVSEALPEFMDPAVSMLKFALEAFPTSKPVEFTLDASIQAYKQRKEQEKNQPPQTPIEVQELQMKQQIEQAKLQMEGQRAMSESQQAAQDAQMKFQIKQQELQFDYNKLQAENNMQMQKMQADMQLQYQKIQGELMLMREKMGVEAQTKVQGHTMDAQVKAEQIRTDATLKQQSQMIDAQLRQQKDEADRQVELAKEAMKVKQKQEADALDAQVSAATAMVQQQPAPEQKQEPQPINVNITVDKGSTKKRGKINKETGEVTVEDVE